MNLKKRASLLEEARFDATASLLELSFLWRPRKAKALTLNSTSSCRLKSSLPLEKSFLMFTRRGESAPPVLGLRA